MPKKRKPATKKAPGEKVPRQKKKDKEKDKEKGKGTSAPQESVEDALPPVIAQ